MVWPWTTDIDENVLTPVYCEKVTKYSATFLQVLLNIAFKLMQ